jgi:hypothetical protein
MATAKYSLPRISVMIAVASGDAALREGTAENGRERKRADGKAENR